MGRENHGTMLGGGVVTNSSPETWDIVNVGAARNRWHHVAMVYDGASFLFFLDGKQRTESAFHTNKRADNGIIVKKNNPLFIGQAGTGTNKEYFVGVIDDLRIFKRALSVAEIQQAYMEEK